MRRRPGDAGFTLVETIVAMLVLTIGLLGTLVVYDDTRGLTGVSERRTELAHRAQQELERVRAIGWSGTAMEAVPSRTAGPAATAGMLSDQDPPRLRPDLRDRRTEEALVVDPVAGRVPAAPRAWSDGGRSGTVQTWVSTWRDPACGDPCGTPDATRRITVVVTDDGDDASRAPVVSSVLVTDPAATPPGSVVDGTRHPLEDPSIACQAPDGSSVPCTSEVRAGSPTSWFLYDTPASKSVWATVFGDHAVSRTVAPVGDCVLSLLSACPTPDLMGDEPPPTPAEVPPLPDRSVDLPGSQASGGRVLLRDDVRCTGTACESQGCEVAPSADNRRSHRWVTPPQPDGLELTGDGGMTLNTRTASGVEARVTLCVQLAVATGPVRELLGVPPVVLGTVSYTLAAWPAVTTPVSFAFDLPGTDLAVAAGRRLAVRVWVAASSRADIVAAYDHPAVQSTLQVNVH